MSYCIDALIPMTIIGLPLYLIAMFSELIRLRKRKALRGAHRL